MEGIDYLETFAPVVKWTTICSIIPHSASKGWILHHMDVITTFLNGLLLEDVFMIILFGFPYAGRICKLLCAFAKPLVLGTVESMLFSNKLAPFKVLKIQICIIDTT